jgi:hypothetical protein
LPETEHIQRELGSARDGGSDGRTARFSIEVKRQERLNIGTWLKQARAQAQQDGSIPVVAYRQNRGDWTCLVELDPVWLAALIRYVRNLDDTAATLEAAVRQKKLFGHKKNYPPPAKASGG